tara:strand:+ start:4788 stop:4970 length:183 start_codon:yes stop_codon:yes gene_type:complete
MTELYQSMLNHARVRLKEIDQVSLEQESYNSEWKELSAMEDTLIKLIKISKGRQDDTRKI